jgi:hypothetical protein
LTWSFVIQIDGMSVFAVHSEHVFDPSWRTTMSR